MFKVTFEAETLHDLDYMIDEFMHRFNGGQGTVVNIVEKSTKKEEQVEEKPIEKVEKAPLTLGEIHKMTSAKAQEGKSKEIKKLLAEMDVEKVINIPEDKFEWYVEKLEAL
ncbi:hypothetical protein [Streptococcus uberis]|uniref:hypothetical protein n=1 Tax=Streptococcus uberis TaxID=1349 RepID=UPI001FF2E98B|nr:hypothetical protein [Streptococcus uberis]MCK1226706.1 hypothetical protein [Streptococcus uberis]